MNNITLTNYTDISFEDSLNMFREFSVKSQNAKYLPPANADNKDFGSDFPGNLIYKPRYTNCRFYNSSFKASNGAFSIFKDTYLYDCFFEDANFNYCNFENCFFEKRESFSILSTGFNFSMFCNCHFNGIDFRGISFRDIYLENCSFDNCIMNNSSFERATIKNTTFTKIDFRNIGIRYCKFINVTFDNVIYPILDLTNNIGLFPIIELQQTKINFSLGYKKEVSLSEAKRLLLGLLPYFKETKQYFSIINILLLNGDYEKVNKLLPIAMKYSIEQCDFDTLQNICQLVVNTERFSTIQLRNFYELIKSYIKPETFPYNLQKGYMLYINNIKNILIDNPNCYPCATINLLTSVDYKTLHLIPIIIQDIELTTKNINPLLSPCIQLTHHSPYEILITLYGMLPDLLRVCQTFYYAFGGIKSFSDIKKSKHEKTENQFTTTNVNNIIVEESFKQVDLSIGHIKLKKETKSTVKKMEYYIN